MDGGGLSPRPVTPEAVGWHLTRIRAPLAWRLTRGEGAVVGVVDVAVDVGHPEFEGRVLPPLTVGGEGAAPLGTWAPHGTRCAGVACAGGVEVTGVAPGATLLPVQVPVLHRTVGSESEAEAIRMAAREGADVILCAWGPPPRGAGSSAMPRHTREAVDWAAAHGRGGRGAVVVWAAGNLERDTALDGYASHGAVLTVGGCNDHDRRCAYGGWGSALFCLFPSSDPGRPERHRPIRTTAPRGSLSLGETYYTDDFGYTSAAAAGLAGLCALLLSVDPDLTRTEVRDLLRSSCVKIARESARYDGSGHCPRHGYGRPDAAVAVWRAALSRQRHRRRRPRIL